MRADGSRIDRVILTTHSAFKAQVGNTWHIPNSTEPPGVQSMRNPLVVTPGAIVAIYDDHQYQGTGDPGNQLQTGSTIFYKKSTDASWSSAAMTYDTTNGNNKYYRGALPAFNAGVTV